MLQLLFNASKLQSSLLPVHIILNILLIRQTLAQTRHIECSFERNDKQGVCVFQNAQLRKNEVGVTFGFVGSTAPSHVAFENCNIAALPEEFWNVFGENLKELEAESCGLTSITVTSKMEILRVRNNSIKALTVQQNCNLIELDVSKNRFDNFKTISTCSKLTTLNLSDNENFALNSLLDLTMFRNLTDLNVLLLSNVGVLYMENTKSIGLSLLHTIDLSRNRIIPADLSMTIFVPFSALETLKLNNNALPRLDYGQLKDIKSLKYVYLNGNSFKCDYLSDMLITLHENQIETPTDRVGSCQPNDREVDGMCCLPGTSFPTKPPVTPPQQGTTTTATTTTIVSTVITDTTVTTVSPTGAPVTKSPSPKNNSTSWIAVTVVMSALIALAGGVFAIIRFKQRRSKACLLQAMGMDCAIKSTPMGENNK